MLRPQDFPAAQPPAYKFVIKAEGKVARWEGGGDRLLDIAALKGRLGETAAKRELASSG